MKKHWYDYLWIASLLYLLLGFFNILFAWLGLLCFFIPLIISVVSGTKSYCNRYCGRGQLFGRWAGASGCPQERHPQMDEKQGVPIRISRLFFAMFFLMLWNTYLVFAGVRDLGQAVTLLWTFKRPGTGPTTAPFSIPAWRSSPSASTASCSHPQSWG